jgi:NAD(P)-dependent dehydrogenase (short-subunit alcohol dehydrogenase family)
MKAVITGGESGIGRAVPIAYAREGADVLIPYLSENDDVKEVKAVPRRGHPLLLHEILTVLERGSSEGMRITLRLGRGEARRDRGCLS